MVVAIIIIIALFILVVGSLVIGHVGAEIGLPSLLTAIIGGAWGYAVSQVAITVYHSLS